MGGSNGTNNYTLAGTPAWQRSQRLKPIREFSHGEKEFISDSLTSETEGTLTGTQFQYIDPQPSDRRLSLTSFDFEDADSGDGEDNASAHEEEVDGGAVPRRPGNFKRAAKKLYPAKVVGGAKVLGSAIRHPMVT